MSCETDTNSDYFYGPASSITADDSISLLPSEPSPKKSKEKAKTTSSPIQVNIRIVVVD